MEYWFWIMVCSIPTILILCQNDFCRTMFHKQSTWNIKGISMSYSIAACKLPKQGGGASGKNSDPSDHSHLQELPKLKIHLDLMNADSASTSLSLWASKHYLQITRSGSGFNDHILLLQHWSHFLVDIHAIAHNKNQLNYTKLTSPWQWTGPRLFPILHFPRPWVFTHFALDAQSHQRIHPFSNLCNPSMESMRIKHISLYIYISQMCFLMKKCRQP